MSQPCKYDCGRAAEKGASRCRTCRRRDKAASQYEAVRYSERRSPDGALLGTNWSYAKRAAADTYEVRSAKPVNVDLHVTIAAQQLSDGEVTLVLPDPQIGFRWTERGDLEPFHDEAALACAVRFAAWLQPDYIVHLGDFLDLAPLSRFAQEAGFARTVQPSIDAGHRFLAELNAVAPGAESYLLEGNHDARIVRSLSKHLPDLALVRAPGAAWPALSIPSLLLLEDLGVTYVDGYPAGRLHLTGVEFLHGVKVNSSGSTAASVATSAEENTVFGHVHRQELHHRTLKTGKTVFSCSPGTLARVDGSVPGFHSAVSSRSGRSVRQFENWQQGMAVVTDADDTTLELVRIDRGHAQYRGVAV